MTICRHLSPTCWNRPLDHQHPSRLMYACLRSELSVHPLVPLPPPLESFWKKKKNRSILRDSYGFSLCYMALLWNKYGLKGFRLESIAQWLSSFYAVFLHVVVCNIMQIASFVRRAYIVPTRETMKVFRFLGSLNMIFRQIIVIEIDCWHFE